MVDLNFHKFESPVVEIGIIWNSHLLIFSYRSDMNPIISVIQQIEHVIYLAPIIKWRIRIKNMSKQCQNLTKEECGRLLVILSNDKKIPM